ncbi:hypothetical protein EHV15_34390 [Paenibacillus oralis]|uniref:Uncharacterized protein n=1 Tax=Paenibacillus oralis TaxID=2490856 RepID=A0A3P3TAZ0_9BACL|nr:hypothetical protein [Paenibacillus oralis]RRJ54689.1 hypothetical protein EHV15_34390 [Paenibacillus oralis]
MDVFYLLLDAVKTNLIHEYYQSIADLVDKETESFLLSPYPLPYNPQRMFISKKQQKLCNELFPRHRTVIWVNSKRFSEYKTNVHRLSIEQYDLNSNEIKGVTNRFAIEVSIWSALKKHNIELESPYFSDKELLELVNIESFILKAIMDVYVSLGRSPSAREYEMIQKNNGGPSLSFIKSEYGTFNNAKAKLKLELWKWKGEKYI